MITNVNVQYILLTGSTATGFRVKKRTGGASDAVVLNTTAPLASDSWTSDPAPASIHYAVDDKDYILAFWSVTAVDVLSGQRSAHVQPYGNVANDSHSGGMWSITAKAYYTWNFGNGGGDNAVLIDAFDIDAGDFIADDFVDVTPDENHALTDDANNGYIDTSSALAPGKPVTIASRDVLPSRKQFAYWLNVPAVFHSADPSAPATVGAPDKHDIVAHAGDVIVAFALYNELPAGRLTVPGQYPLYNPWWWIETRGGLVPGPPEPWRQALIGLAALGTAAASVSPQFRNSVLAVALKQLSMLEDDIRQALDRS